MGIFDSYNLRARGCAAAVYLIPFALDGICLIPRIQSLPEGLAFSLLGTVLFQTVLSMFCRQDKCRSNRQSAARLLEPGSELPDAVRARRYRKLGELEPAFQPLALLVDPGASPAERQSVDTQKLCEDVIFWLRAKSRDRTKFYLVYEENINYGFFRNLLEAKGKGIAVNLLAAALLGGWIYLAPGQPVWLTRKTAALFLAFHGLAVLFYVFAVRKAAVDSAAKRYAYALLEVIDILKA